MESFEQVLAAAQKGKTFEIVTLLTAPSEHRGNIGSMLCCDDLGAVYGEIISREFSQQVIDLMHRQVLTKPGIISSDDGCYQFFVDEIKRPKSAVICGAGHISVPLTDFLHKLDFEVTVIDDRPEFANHHRFPQAKRVICDSFAKVLASMDIDKQTAVIIVTRGHRYDADCLRILIRKESGYLGMIGSRRRIQAIREILSDEGITSEMLQNVYAPIGLDIGAKTPAEIALSIAAEIVSVSRNSTYLPLSMKEVRHEH